MSNKNIANLTTFNSILVNNLEIQSSSVGLSIYSDDPNNPVYSFNPATRVFNMIGDLNVSGAASFESINFSELDGGIFSIGAANTADTIDLGINGTYNDGVEKYTGIVRDCSDSLKRWTFYQDVITEPVTTVEPLDENTVAPIRVKSVYVNNGSELLPSITFSNDIGQNTGFFLINENEIGITASGSQIVSIKRTSPTISDFSLKVDTSLNLAKFNTVDDSILSNAISTGHVMFKSETANDKWFKLYSNTSAAIPSYSGSVYSSATNHYFMTSIGAAFKISGRTHSDLDTAPDYRVANTDLFVINGITSTESKVPLNIVTGTLGNLSLRFGFDLTTGLYSSAGNSIGIVCAGSNIINIAPTDITFSQKTLNSDGSLAAPSIAFTSTPSTGFFKNGALLSGNNISVSIAGNDIAKFTRNGTNAQFLMPLGGTAAFPSISFTDNDTGFYSPTNESTDGQLALSLGGIETIRFRRKSGTIAQGFGNIEIFNSTVFTPNNLKKIAILDSDTFVNNNLKAYNSSFQSYNIIDDLLLFLYTFRSTNAIGTDYSNNSITATAVGNPNIKSGETDNTIIKRDVLNFTENNVFEQYLNLTTHLTQLQNLTNVAMSFWFKIGAVTTDNTIFNCHKLSEGKNISIVVLADGTLQITMDVDAGNSLQYNTVAIVDNNLWHHVVVHFGAARVGSTIFLDNIKLSSALATIVYTSSGNNASGPLATNSFVDLTFDYVTFGALFDGTSADLRYTGFLKDIYFTRRALTDIEVANLYTEPIVYMHTLDVARINASEINVETPTLFPNGTTASPSISFSNYSNTGIYMSSLGFFGAPIALGIATEGIERVYISDTILQYNNNNFQIDSTNKFMKLKMGTGANGPKMVFDWTNTWDTKHYISTSHGATAAANYFDFFLADINSTALGTNNVMRIGQSAAGPNSAVVSVFGVQRNTGGSVTLPSYSFTTNTSSGMYSSAADTVDFAAGSVQRLKLDTVATIGNAAGDTITKLYVPLGTVALPTYSFIGDADTGIFSTAANTVDFTTGGVQRFKLDTVATIGNAAGDTTTKLYVPLGTVALPTYSFIGDVDTGIFSTAANTVDFASGGVQRLKLNTVATIGNAAGDTTTKLYVPLGTAALPTYSFIGDSDTGIFSTATDTIDFATGSIQRLKLDTVATIGNAAGDTTTKLYVPLGTAALPTYSFIGDSNTGIYSPNDDQVGIATNSAIRKLFTSTFEESLVPLRLSSGTVTLPGLTFSADTSQDTGLYWISDNRFGVSNGNQNTWIFNNRVSAPHESLNILDCKPDGTNLRMRIEDTKLRVSSNQTILNILPILHYKFSTNPSANLLTQDESISKYAIVATTAAYVVSTVSLTDSTGEGLLRFAAVQFVTAATDRIETNLVSNLLFLTDYTIFIKFKLVATTSGNLFEIYGNRATTTSNFIRMSTTTTNLTINVHNGTSTIITASTTNNALVTNLWYNLTLRFSATGNSAILNGVASVFTYSVGTAATTFNPNQFTDKTNLTSIVGGTAASISAYIAQYYISPTVTNETATALYRTQAHEIYTNKLQIANTFDGLTDEGSSLISDKGNNAIWDNSVQIKANTVQINNNKVLRGPNGTVALPLYSFTNSVSTGMFSTVANNVDFAAGGIQRLKINTVVTVGNSAGDSTTRLYVPLGTLALPAYSFIGDTDTGMFSTAANTVDFAAGAVQKFKLNTVATVGNAAGDTITKLYVPLGTVALPTYSFIGDTDTGIFSTAADTIDFAAAGVQRFKLNTVATVGNAAGDTITKLYVPLGTVALPTYSFIGDTDTGVYSPGANQVSIATSGVNRVNITDTLSTLSNDLKTNSGYSRKVQVYSGPFPLTLDSTFNLVEISTTANIVINLPSVATNAGREYTIINISSGFTVTVNSAGGQFIDNDTSTSIVLSAQFDKLTLISNGVSRWYSV